jgi:zinc transport system ATP-binding protein
VSAPALEVRGVSLSFGDQVVLEDVDFELEEGGFLGIIGPNGGGKTKLLEVVLGLVRPDRGEVRVFGRPPEEARGQVGWVPQHAAFDRRFPIQVRDVVLMGRLGAGRLTRRFDRRDRERALEALERVGMADLARRQIGRISGGQLQRVLVARALATDARLFLLDEPTSSLDPRGGVELYAFLEELAPTKTVVVVTHDVGVISGRVRKIACLNRRLWMHEADHVTQEMIEKTYGFPRRFLVHGEPHVH